MTTEWIPVIDHLISAALIFGIVWALFVKE